MAVDAILFDLDGTLWKGNDWYAELLSNYLIKDRIEIQVRLTSGERILDLACSLGLSRAKLISLCLARTRDLVLYDGVLETLQELSSAGVRLGVVTSAVPKIALACLQDLNVSQYFQAICHPGVMHATKPSPAPLLWALGQMNVRPSHSVYMIGDSYDDMVSARRANVSFAWASYGYGHLDTEAQVPRVSSFREVANL